MITIFNRSTDWSTSLFGPNVPFIGLLEGQRYLFIANSVNYTAWDMRGLMWSFDLDSKITECKPVDLEITIKDRATH